MSKEDEKIVAAHYERTNAFAGKKAKLIINQEGLPILNFILVSFILVEKITRETGAA